MNNQPFPALTLSIESAEYDVNDDYWQDECRRLFQQLRREIPDITLEPVLEQPIGTGHKGVLEVFNQLVMYGISMGTFANLFQLLKYWLERHEQAEIQLKFPDGSLLKVQNLTVAEAEQKIQEHLATYLPTTAR